jgi:hypothetical protein
MKHAGVFAFFVLIAFFVSTLPGSVRPDFKAAIIAALHGSSALQPPRFTVSAEGDGASLTVSDEGETIILDVRSRSGIGRATVKMVAGKLPEKIVLRLRVKGLEEFRLLHNLSRDGAEIIARVSSSDGGVTQSLRSRDGDEQPITSASPRWLAIRIVSDSAAPRIPLEQGHFEIILPRDFLREADRAFSIRWIDFYR